MSKRVGLISRLRMYQTFLEEKAGSTSGSMGGASDSPYLTPQARSSRLNNLGNTYCAYDEALRELADLFPELKQGEEK